MFLRIHEPPGATIPRRVLPRIVGWRVMLRHATFEVIGVAGVATTRRFTDQHVDEELQAPRLGLEPKT
jgi:hypothetical protein